MYVRVTPRARTSSSRQARNPYGKQVWATIGTTDELKIEEARDKAREAIRRIKEGKPAFEPPPVQPESFEAVAANWFQRHVQEPIAHRSRDRALAQGLRAAVLGRPSVR